MAMGRRTIEFCIISLMVLMFASCRQTFEPDALSGDEMLFAPEYPGAVSKATETSFEEGDKIGIFAVDYDEKGQARRLELSGNWANNCKAHYEQGKWTVNPKIYWDGKETMDIYSYYPYVEELESVDNFRFEIKTDQRDKGLTLSDFLWANTIDAKRDDGTIPLQFSHRLSRLDIRLAKGEDYEGELPREAIVKVHGTVPVALADLESGDVVKDPDSATASIIAHCNAPGDYSAIIVPQKILTQIPLIEVIAKDVSYLVSSKFIFQGGMRHSVNIILSDNPDKVIINIGGGIDDWN